MIYLVDIGNTRLKYITLSKNTDITEYRNNEWNNDIHSILATEISESWLASSWSNASKIIIASVNKNSQIGMISSWADAFDISIEVIKSSDCAHGVISGYRFYQQLGVDRWLALIGAHHRYPKQSLVIIDSGTATTVDILVGEGVHQGGWILPGIDLMQGSIISGTAHVISEKRKPSFSFGTNTVDNVSNACWAATLGLINMAIFELNKAKEPTEALKIIFTGGNGKQLQELFEELQSNNGTDKATVNPIFLPNKSSSTRNSEFVPELIFYGLIQYISS